MIKHGSVVSMSYRLTNDAGEELDRAEKAEPFTYLHGVGQIVPGLQDALEGLKIGDKRSVVLQPEEAYGDVNEQLRITVDRSDFPPNVSIAPGMQFMADMGQGQQMVFTVTDVDGDAISVDGNHPLAGETLHFDVEIIGIREATQEEMAHGHAHGPDGHHHHD